MHDHIEIFTLKASVLALPIVMPIPTTTLSCFLKLEDRKASQKFTPKVESFFGTYVRLHLFTNWFKQQANYVYKQKH